jgi:hypothetical protein
MLAMPVSDLYVCVPAPCRLSKTSFSCCRGSNVWNSNHAHTPPTLNKRLGTPTSRIKTTPDSTVTLPNQPPQMWMHMAKVLLSSTTRVAAVPKFSSQVSVTSSEPGPYVLQFTLYELGRGGPYQRPLARSDSFTRTSDSGWACSARSLLALFFLHGSDAKSGGVSPLCPHWSG